MLSLNDIEVLDRKGNPVSLSRFWGEQAVVLVFVRHFG